MRDAFGGLVNISMIVVFLVIVSGYLAFNVSYTKAFRVKNKIITTIEQYEGNCGDGTACASIIKDYADKIGYNPGEFSTTTDSGCNEIHAPGKQNGGYFIEKCPATDNSSESTSGTSIHDNIRYFFKVETAIQIDIPIINKVMTNLKVFRLAGNTKLISVRSR